MLGAILFLGLAVESVAPKVGAPAPSGRGVPAPAQMEPMPVTESRTKSPPAEGRRPRGPAGAAPTIADKDDLGDLEFE